MTRLMGLAFWGQSRVDPHVEGKIHEPPRAMTWVLVALAGLATVGGGLGLPVGKHLMRDWLAPSFAGTEAAAAHAGEAAGHAAAGGHHVSGWLEVGLMGASVAAAVVGIGVGLWFYRKGRGERAEAAARKARWAYRILKGKYFVDELYDATVLRAYYKLCDLAGRFDVRVVDGLVNGTRHFTVGISYLSAFWDSWVVDGLVNSVGYTLRGGSWVLRRLQSGFVQAYAAAMVFGIFVLLCVYLFLEMGSQG
jgi:NADH-quinone oxidoreductase subunit L